MSSKLLLFLIIPISLIAETQTWLPSQHIATIQRTFTGFTEPSQTLDIKAEFTARLTKFHIKENNRINSNNGHSTLIAEQDDRFARLDSERAEASLRIQERLLKSRLTQKKTQEREVSYRLLELRRQRKLVQEKSISQSTLDLAQFEYDRAKLSLQEIDAAIDLQRQTILEQQNLLETAQEKLRRHKIYAPTGWIMNQKYIEEGTLLSSGMNICQLVNIKELSVFFRLSEKEMANLNPNNIAISTATTGKKITARLHRVDRNFDPTSRKRLVELRLSGNDFPEASGGLEVKLLLTMPFPQEAVEIPLSFTQKKLEKYFIKLHDGRQIPLSPLRRDQEKIIIKASDLPKNARLIQFP